MKKKPEPDFRVLFEAVPGLYLVLDPELRIVALSDAYAGATMLLREDVLGRNIFEVFPDNPDDPAAEWARNLKTSLQQVLQSHLPDAMQVRKYNIRKPEAAMEGIEARFWSAVNTPVVDEVGNLRYIFHALEDVTEFVSSKPHGLEQVRLTEELQPSLTGPVIQGASSNAPLVLVIDDNQAMCAFISAALAPHYRVATAFDGGEGVSKALQLAPALILSDEMMRAVRGEPMVQELRRHRELDDVPIIMLTARADDEVRAQLLREGAQDSLSKPFAVEELLARVKGIFDTRHRAEEMRMQLEAIVESTDDAIIGKTLDGTITSWNRAAQKLFGYSAREAIGKSIFMLFPPGKEYEERDILSRVSRGQTVKHFDTERVRKDGRRVEVSVTNSPIRDRQGRIIGVSKIAMDVTERKRIERSLHESEQLFWSVFQASPAAVMLTRLSDNRIVEANSAFLELTGRKRDALIGHSADEFGFWCNPAQRTQQLQELRRKKQLTNLETAFRRRSGEAGLSLSAMAMVELGGEQHVLDIINDITERMQAEESLRQAAIVFNSTQEGIAITDLAGNIVAVNPALARMTEYSADEMVGRNMRILKSGMQDHSFYFSMWHSILTTGSWQGEIWNRRKGGETFPLLLTVNTVKDTEAKPVNYVGVFTDITHTQHYESEFEYLAHHDALTDLPNRLLLHSRMEHAFEHAKRNSGRCAVLFIDLDRFKEVNDTLGHLVGDEVLKMVAQRMRERLRDIDTLARLGGDEFVVLMEALPSLKGAEELAAGLIDRVSQPYVLPSGEEVDIGASIGISIYPEDGTAPDQLIHNADAALYKAKNAGRGRYCYFTT